MEKLVLKSQKRDLTTRAKDLRKKSRVPAVLYGKEGDNINLDLDYQEFRKMFIKAGYNTIVDLEIDGKSIEVLIHDVQYHPVTGDFIHTDFKKIVRGVEITTEVQIKFEGTSEAVKTLGGVLMTNKESVMVKCLPRDLIHELVADLSLLKDFGNKITVADLSAPKEVKILDETDVVLATVVTPRAVLEEEETETSGESASEEDGGEETSEAETSGEKTTEEK